MLRRRLLLALGIGILFAGLSACGVSKHQAASDLPDASKYEPTLFFHG